MDWQRREILGALALLGGVAQAAPQEQKPMYGLIGKLVSAAGKRDELISLLLQGSVVAVFELLLAAYFYGRVYRHAVRTGLLARYSAESVA